MSGGEETDIKHLDSEKGKRGRGGEASNSVRFGAGHRPISHCFSATVAFPYFHMNCFLLLLLIYYHHHCTFEASSPDAAMIREDGGISDAVPVGPRCISDHSQVPTRS